jgi:hypothetical protein
MRGRDERACVLSWLTPAELALGFLAAMATLHPGSIAIGIGTR